MDYCVVCLMFLGMQIGYKQNCKCQNVVVHSIALQVSLFGRRNLFSVSFGDCRMLESGQMLSWRSRGKEWRRVFTKRQKDSHIYRSCRLRVCQRSDAFDGVMFLCIYCYHSFWWSLSFSLFVISSSLHITLLHMQELFCIIFLFYSFSKQLTHLDICLIL